VTPPDETICWEYAIIQVRGGIVVDVETPEGKDQAALNTGKGYGLLAAMNYLGSQGWKLSEGTGPVMQPQHGDLYLIFSRRSEGEEDDSGVFHEPPS
jgi:hypothetical protein